MARTIRARFTKGMIEPMEDVGISEGEEITITILEAPSKRKTFAEVLKSTAGAWKDTVDCDELIKNIYADRLISTRPVVKL